MVPESLISEEGGDDDEPVIVSVESGTAEV